MTSPIDAMQDISTFTHFRSFTHFPVHISLSLPLSRSLTLSFSLTHTHTHNKFDGFILISLEFVWKSERFTWFSSRGNRYPCNPLESINGIFIVRSINSIKWLNYPHTIWWSIYFEAIIRGLSYICIEYPKWTNSCNISLNQTIIHKLN